MTTTPTDADRERASELLDLAPMGGTPALLDAVAQALADERERALTADDASYAWRLTKRPNDDSAHVELGSMYADFDGAALTLLIHSVGKGLIKAGTLAMESTFVQDDDEYEDGDFDGDFD